MNNDINNLFTLKEIEQNLFQELQSVYQNILVSILDDVDVCLRDNRDFDRLENREMQECKIATMFGSIKICGGRERRHTNVDLELVCPCYFCIRLASLSIFSFNHPL